MDNRALPPLILASSSQYRRELLLRLTDNFTCHAANIDERARELEEPEELVRRLAQEKAQAVAHQVLTPATPGLVIGSDQVAVMDGDIIGKSGNKINAVNQLRRSSGNDIKFITSLYLYNNLTGTGQICTVPCIVRFRELTDTTIENYLAREPAFDCAGSFKSEGLGITLFKAIDTTDSTALIGLPLIELSRLLRDEGYDLLENCN